MTSNRVVKIVLYILMCLVFLYAINEDLFSYYDAYHLNRSFRSDLDGKGDYLLTPVMTLKKGIYEIGFEVKTSAPGNGYYVIDGDNQRLIQDEFLPDIEEELVELRVDQTAVNIRIGVTYEPSTGYFEVPVIVIRSDHVLTRDSLLRHAVVSLFLILLFALIGVRLFSQPVWTRIVGRLSTPANERIWIYLLMMAAMTSFPFFYDKIYVRTDDYMFHLLRVEGIKVALENGIFPVRVNPFFLEGYGYGDGLFYPNITMVFPAVLRLLGFHPITAYKIFVITLNFLSIACFYWVTAKIAKSRYSGLIGATFYAFASYRLVDILWRCGMGEAQAFLFTPLILLGLIEIYSGHPERWGWFALGFLGLTWSHLLSLVLSGLFVAGFVVIRVKDLLKDRRILFALVKSALLVLGLSAFFFLPMAEQVLTTTAKANILISPISLKGELQWGIVPSAHIFTPISGWKPLVDPNLGLPLLLLPLVFLTLRKSDHSWNKKLAVVCLIAGLVAVFVSTGWFPWRQFAWIANRLQFSWRVLLIAVPLLSLAAGLISESVIAQSQKKFALFGLLAVCALTVAPMYFNVIELRLVTQVPLHLESQRVSGGEYLPAGSNVDLIDKNKNTVLSNDPNVLITSHGRKTLRFSFEFERPASGESSEPLRFEIPLLYYTGYVAEYEAPGQEAIALTTYLGDNGLVGVDLPEGAVSGRVTASYQTTQIQRIGDWITLLTLVGCIVFGVRAWKKKKA